MFSVRECKSTKHFGFGFVVRISVPKISNALCAVPSMAENRISEFSKGFWKIQIQI
jgi:hypothetical protein